MRFVEATKKSEACRMGERQLNQYTDNDIKFLLETVAPGLLSKIDTIKRDQQIIERMLEEESEKLFQRIMFDEGQDLAAVVSPRFLFEILLRRAFVELQNRSYTIERTASQKIPVFDSKEVVEFMSDKKVLKYLADMLTSFTRTESFTMRVRVRRGIWRRIRFSDMDVDSLIRLCEVSDEEHRFGLYKRIGDLSLFILGIFPEYVIRDYNLTVAPHSFRRWRRSEEEYEELGRRFYRMAGVHQDAQLLDLSDVFLNLQEKFTIAKKPLNYISGNFIQINKERLFPAPP
jgi:hypothetical protein